MSATSIFLDGGGELEHPANARAPGTEHSGLEDSLETELKFAAPSTQTASAIQLLDSLCEPDPAFARGIVASIYYDSRDWAYLQEKRNSDYLKTKVRVRWYEQLSGGAENDISFTEVKHRVGSKRVKFRIPSRWRGAELACMDLADRQLLEVPRLLARTGFLSARAIFPAFEVRYERRRYVDPRTDVRIALDYRITAPRVNKNMLPNASRCVLQHTVLEVKGGDSSLPPRLRCLVKLGFRKVAFSKYFECFRLLSRTVF
jgi:hypothetical protein